jgi:hypothetical protein
MLATYSGTATRSSASSQAASVTARPSVFGYQAVTPSAEVAQRHAAALQASHNAAQAMQSVASAPAGLQPITTRAARALQDRGRASTRADATATARVARSGSSGWTARVSGWLHKQAARTGSGSLQCVEYPLETCSSPVHVTHVSTYDIVHATRVRSSQESAGTQHDPRRGAQTPRSASAGHTSRSPDMHVQQQLHAALSHGGSGAGSGMQCARPRVDYALATNSSFMQGSAGARQGDDLAAQSVLSTGSVSGPPFLPMPPPMASHGALCVDAAGEVVARYPTDSLHDGTVQVMGPNAC